MTLAPVHFYAFSEFRLYTDERVLTRGAEVIVLPPKAFEALVLLVENSGRVVGKDELIKRVWPDSFVEETNIAQHIFSLRRALNVSQGERTFIETVPKRGYRFVLKAQEGWDETGTLDFKRARTAGVKPPEAREGKTVITSVAVLPLANASHDPKAEYLSDLITECIINSLSELPQLRVMARSVVLRYKDKDVDPQKLGREIGVQAVVIGTLLQVDDRFIIGMELVDVANGWQLWGARYDREISNIASLEQEISRTISENLRLRLVGTEGRHLQNTGSFRAHNT